MPPPWTSRDMAVGNNMLPLYQLIAQNQRRVNMAQPMPPPAARAPNEDSAPIFAKPGPPPPAKGYEALDQMPGVQVIQRHPQHQGAPQSAPNATGLAGMLEGMTPEEKNRMRGAWFGGLAGGLSDVMARNPNAGIGEMLLGAAAGGSAGQMAGQRDLRSERREGRRDQLLEAQIGQAEAKAQQEATQQAQMQAVLDDPNVPESQKRVIGMALAGVPAAGIEAMAGPKPMSEYERARVEQGGRALDIQAQRASRAGAGGQSTPFGTAATGYWTMGPDGKAVQIVPAAPGAAGAPKEDWERYERVGDKLIDPKTERVVYDASAGEDPGAKFERDYVLRAAGRPGGRPERVAAEAREARQRIEGTFQPPPPPSPEGPGLLEQAGDWAAQYMPWAGEEAPATAAPGPAAPTAGDFGSMSAQALEALDPNTMSKEDRAAAAARWDELFGG